VSVEVISWALNLAPVPADRGGQPSSACKFVLVGLANHAGPDGTGAFPSVATLVRYTGLSERTVRICLDRLEAEGIISPCDPDIVAARIKQADRRPQGWDLNVSLVRDNLEDAAVAVLEHQFPGLGSRLAVAVQPSANRQSDGVQSLHPVGNRGEAVDNWPNGVQRLHPKGMNLQAMSRHAPSRSRRQTRSQRHGVSRSRHPGRAWPTSRPWTPSTATRWSAESRMPEPSPRSGRAAARYGLSAYRPQAWRGVTTSATSKRHASACERSSASGQS